VHSAGAFVGRLGAAAGIQHGQGYDLTLRESLLQTLQPPSETNLRIPLQLERFEQGTREKTRCFDPWKGLR
jgi:hypothetical protein